MDDTDLRSKAVQKTQMKRDTYRVLGSRNAQSALETSDPEVFNDHDFYQLMLNDFLSQNDKGHDEEMGGTGEGDEFLYGADLSMT